MSATDWMVVAGGLAAILWVNWYFFFAQRAGASAVVGTDRGQAKN